MMFKKLIAIFLTAIIFFSGSTYTAISAYAQAPQNVSPTFGTVGDCQTIGNCPSTTPPQLPTGGVSPTIDPCVSTSVERTAQKSKKKKKKKVDGLTKSILNLIIELLNILIQLLGGNSSTPSNPPGTSPTSSPSSPTIDPSSPTTAPLPPTSPPTKPTTPPGNPCPPGTTESPTLAPVTDTPTNAPSSPTATTAPGGPTNPPTTAQGGVWISKDELMKLPMSGAAWDKVRGAANGGWGSANLGDNNAMHDVHTLAGALVAARTGDAAMKNKVIAGLKSAMGSGLSRALEASRGLQTYIISADLIDYHDPAFEAWVRKTINAGIQGHSGSGIMGTATNAPNNWGGHARASVAAAAVYLKDKAMLDKLVTAHKAFIGVSAPGNTMVYQGTNWHADNNNKAGVNRKGSKISGKNVSGVLPEDWRRASGFQWPPGATGYMWEGMQGFVVSAVILDRAGAVPLSEGDNAVVRAMDILYGTGEGASNSPVYKNPASGDDTWIPWVVNKVAGTNYPTQAAASGKNMGWTDWTHAK